MRHRRRPKKRHQCDGKEPIPTKEQAIGKALRVQYTTGARRMQAYKCRYCKKWHIGHG